MIAKNVNLMVVLGDKKSSNTKKIYEISCEYCKNTIFIENVDELNIENIKDMKKIGIMAGASTPNEQIEIVKGRLK